MSPLLLRLLAHLAATLAVFAPLLASLGARGDGDARLAISAALSVALVLVVSRCDDDGAAVGASGVGFFALSLITWKWGAPLLPVARGAIGRTDITDWLGEPLLHTLLLMPLSFAACRGADHDSDDAPDRLALAAAVSLAGALVETTLYVGAVRSRGGSYPGLAAVALGPTLMGLLVLASLGALAALVRGARWMRRWRRLVASGEVRVEARSCWPGAVPNRPWLKIAQLDNDGVLVRRSARAAGAYRAGDGDQALTAFPLGGVTGALWARMATSLALLAALALLTVTRLASLRW